MTDDELLCCLCRITPLGDLPGLVRYSSPHGVGGARPLAYLCPCGLGLEEREARGRLELAAMWAEAGVFPARAEGPRLSVVPDTWARRER